MSKNANIDTGLLISGCTIAGIGIGLLVHKPGPGTLIGVALGLLAAAALRGTRAA